MRQLSQKLPSFIFLLLLVFLLIFPKGGIKYLEIPITWGYLFLLLLSILLLFRKHTRIDQNRLIALTSLFPLQIIFLFSVCFMGYEHGGFALSFFFNLFILPACFYFLISQHLDTLPITFLYKGIRWSVFLISLYGIFLFLYKFYIGSFIQLPYLTINAQDIDLLETTKAIDRGGIFKLISTYNNGNLFGICLLMLIPLYNLCEPHRFLRIVVKIALLLTLSRTVWYGLIFSECLSIIILHPRSFKKWIELPLVLTTYLWIIFQLNAFMQRKTAFLMDTSMGGRDEFFSILSEFSLLPTKAFSGIIEIVPLGFLQQLGILGCLAYFIGCYTPILLGLNIKMKTLPHKAILIGLITYALISFSDGAFLFIPTLAIFFFLASLIHRHFDQSSPSFKRFAISSLSSRSRI